MATILAFAVPSLEVAEDTQDQLRDAAADSAVIYRDERGHLVVQQTSDLSAGRGAGVRLLADVVAPVGGGQGEGMKCVAGMLSGAIAEGAVVVLLVPDEHAGEVEAAISGAGIGPPTRWSVRET